MTFSLLHEKKHWLERLEACYISDEVYLSSITDSEDQEKEIIIEEDRDYLAAANFYIYSIMKKEGKVKDTRKQIPQEKYCEKFNADLRNRGIDDKWSYDEKMKVIGELFKVKNRELFLAHRELSEEIRADDFAYNFIKENTTLQESSL